jgi:phosphate transport system substrate-binding protein
MRCGVSTLIVLMFCGVSAYAQTGDKCRVAWGRQESLQVIAPRLVDAFKASRPDCVELISANRNDRGNLGYFATTYSEPLFDVLIHSQFPDAREYGLFRSAFPKDSPQAGEFYCGERRVLMIIAPENPVRGLSLEEIGTLLKEEGKATTWKTFGGEGTTIKCYGETAKGWSRDLLRRQCMAYSEKMPGYTRHGWRPFRDDFQALTSTEEVIAKVKGDPSAIGFIQYKGKAVEGVKVLAVRGEIGMALPRLEPVRQDEYPLSEPLVVYLHPKSPAVGKVFCEFAQSVEGAMVAERYGVITPRMEYEYLAEKRLAEAKAGRGVKLTVLGVLGGQVGGEVLGALTAEYVRAKEAAQTNYMEMDSDGAAVGMFLAQESVEARGLLVLTEKVSGKTIGKHRETWNQVNPAEYVLAGRGVAVVVNAANTLDGITLEQLKAIYSGAANEWSVIGKTGLADGVMINALGLRANDPAAGVFHRECVAAQEMKKVTIKENTADVLRAIRLDKQAIGFVDWSAIPASGQAVKVLAIVPGKGESAKPVLPSSETIKSATYPLSQRLYLYVHPGASETAKRFADFMATSGASEAKAGADTVQTVMGAYRRNGLVALSEAALERGAKDDATAGAKARTLSGAKTAPAR